MIRASRNRSVAAALCALAVIASAAIPARAAIETDPNELYATMRRAFDEGAAKSWPFTSELYYEATVIDAGRSYSLFKPDDPNYALVAGLTVDVATQLHYNPLTSNDASLWYVQEAAAYVAAHGAPDAQAKAAALRTALDAGQADQKTLGAQAEAAALANVDEFPRDGDARVALLVADVRAYNLTHDDAYRSALLQHAADLKTPLTRVPDPEYGEMFSIAAAALADPGYSDDDRAAAKTIKQRRDSTPELQTIARITSIPHELKLTRTAPADEYFGHLKISPIGIHNEVIRVNKYLDVGWGYRMQSAALQVDSAVEDWQKQYPRDYTLPAELLDTYKLLQRIGTPETKASGDRVKNLLLVQYPSTRQAQELAASS